MIQQLTPPLDISVINIYIRLPTPMADTQVAQQSAKSRRHAGRRHRTSTRIVHEGSCSLQKGLNFFSNAMQGFPLPLKVIFECFIQGFCFPSKVIYNMFEVGHYKLEVILYTLIIDRYRDAMVQSLIENYFLTRRQNSLKVYSFHTR